MMNLPLKLAAVAAIGVLGLASANAQAQAGPVASYSFEEGSGTTTVDSSGNNNTGTLSGATWTTSGKYGKALSFDGVNDLVNIANSNSTRLTTAMTLEAWVYPTAGGTTYRTVVLKEVTAELSYSLYASGGVTAPSGWVRVGTTSRNVNAPSALPLNTWTHIAATYGSGTLRFYVNGAQVASQALTGNIVTSTRPLFIGGNQVWGEFFAGRIDEVKIYNRVLSVAEIAADMAGGVTTPRVTITSPANNATITGDSVNVAFTTSGDTSQASFVALRVDSGATTFVPLTSPVQLNGVAFGTHTLNGWLARADQSKITGSDATAVAFTTQAVPGPKLTITAPTNNSTVVGGTVNVSFSTSGDLTEADHVHLSLDGGPDLMVMSLSGSLQLDAVALGAHTLTGYVVRADHSKITGSDATQVAFTVTAALPPPVLAITSPTNNATINGSTATVAFSTSGDLTSGAHHVHLRVDGGADREVTGLSGNTQITGLTAGAHTVTGYVARADHSKITSSDSATVNFTVTINNPNDPAIVGQWTGGILQLPTVAVDLALLHTGKAIFWAGEFTSAPNFGELWDPATNQITPVPNPFSNIFCSSHVHLADGRLLVAGGHDAQAGIMGIAKANTFDPVTESWSPLPDMAFRRWYPTLTLLGDGRAIILSGSSDSETVFVEIPEIYDPVTNRWTRLNNAALSIPQYPMVWQLGDGRILQSGTTETPTVTRTLDIATQTWTTIDPQVLEGGSGVMYAPGRIMKSGSGSNDGLTPNAVSTATTYVLDMNQPNPAFRQTASMAFPRTFHNLTSLADGSVIATSGSRRRSETDLSFAVLEPELWSPETETWTTMAPAQTRRVYHSTAILLPDGRVAVSGSGNVSGATDQRSLEIFSPPYLFKGPRPTLTSVPSLVKYGTSFFVQTPDGANIKAVNLVRPGADTHNFDQDQRFVPTTFTVVAGGLQVNAPTNPNIATPGHYMLFLISNAGVPSVSKFIRFPAAYEDTEPPSAPGTVQGSGGIGSSTLTWLPATDNIGVARYEVYRSTSAVFTPSAANFVGQTTGTSYTDSGLATGTYYYAVLAVDGAGTKSVASNTVSVNVLSDTVAPTVSITALSNGSTVSGSITLTATAADNVGVAGVTFRLDGVALGTEDTSAPYSATWNTITSTNGTHTITAVARDTSSNSTVSTAVSVNVSNTAAPVPPGLVAAWGFNEGTGTTTADTSGGTNVGTVSGATWTTSGKYGNALSFDGVNDMVSVADAASLDLTNAMTLSAWVYPTAQNGWDTVILKEATGNFLAYALYSGEDTPRPSAFLRINSQDRSAASASALPLNAWSHLAATYDGTTLRLFVNGTQVATLAQTGSVSPSTLPLRIGGNSIWGEYFNGRIDEAHVYNRALTTAEITVDMNVGAAPAVPKVNITSPANNASITGSTLNVSFTTSGDTSQASFVALRVDSGAVTLSPLAGPVQFTGLTPGVHSLNGWLARADQSKIDGSDANTVTFTMIAVDNTPKLSITAPTANSNITGTTVNVTYSTSGDLSQAHHAYIKLDTGPEMMVQALSGQLQIEEVAGGAHSLTGYIARSDNSKITGSDATAVPFTTTIPDTTKPVVVILAPIDGSTISSNVTLNANATDNASVAGVQFKLDGASIGAEDTVAPYSFVWNTTAVSNGVHVLTAVARDTSNNTATSLAVNVVVLNATAPVPPGLVAAYGFEAGTGTTTADASGQGNVGTLAGATWTTSGKFGNALSFDGNDMVNIPDAASLDLTNAMTLSAWVYPTAQSGWGTVILKEGTNVLSYALYSSEDTPRPSSFIRIGSTDRTTASAGALPLNTWTHLATTYDGANLRLYANGVQVGTLAVTGSMAATTRPLRIGGNSIWSEFFTGRIDEVRVFNRALSVAEIQSTMNAPVVGAPTAQPTRSTPITVDSVARHVWVVNPDSDTVTRINADTLAIQMEIPVGKRPTSITVDGANQVWVTCRDDDTVWVLNAATGALVQTFTTAWGSAPVSVVLTPDRATGYIAFQGTGQIQRFVPQTRTLGPVISLGTTPRALAVTADAKKLLVTQFISTGGSAGTVRTVDLTTFAAGSTLQLPLDTTSIDGSLAGRGLPNYLAGIAADPANGIAWVVAKKDNIVRGVFRDSQPLTFETTVRAMVSRLDLNQNQEQLNRRLDLDNSSSPSAVALSESGALALVTLQGNNRLVVLNQIGTEIVRANTGLAPEGVAIDPVTKRIFTQDLMSRTVTVLDGAALLNQGQAQLPQVAQVPTVQVEKMSPMELKGKQIFYNAEDPRMSRDGYLSCASCHVNGEHDGQTWDFTDRGEGFRNTTKLLGFGQSGARLHWSGNFDEIQDFENDIRGFFGGTGFMSNQDFTGYQDPLGPRKGGLSADLDALEQYINVLRSAGRSPYRQANGAMTAGAVAGQTVFESLNCLSCHTAPLLTDSSNMNGIRHDVGTKKASSGNRMGMPLDGFDTPTLRGLWATAPYLHDGSAPTLRDVLTTANPTGAHGNVSSLTPAQIDQVVEYLQQIDGLITSQ